MTTSAMAILAAAQAAETCSKCPPHAIASVAAALAVGLAIGFAAGRRTKKCGCQGGQKRRAAQNGRGGQGSDAPRQPIPAGSVEIYVGNLSYDMTEEQLRKTFGKFGTVDAARVVMNRGTGKSKGFGFVVMPNRKEAEAAIAELSEKEVLGRRMRVNEAQNTIKEEA